MTDSCRARRVAERSSATSESRACRARRMLSYTDSEGSTLVIWNLMLRPARRRRGGGGGQGGAGDPLQGGALAGPVGAEDPGDLPRLDGEVDARQRPELAEALADARD